MKGACPGSWRSQNSDQVSLTFPVPALGRGQGRAGSVPLGPLHLPFPLEGMSGRVSRHHGAGARIALGSEKQRQHHF